MDNNVAKQASVLLRYIPEYIRRYPSAKSIPYTARRGVVGKMITSLYKKYTYYAWTYRWVIIFFFFWSFYPMIRGEILIYVSPDIS